MFILTDVKPAIVHKEHFYFQQVLHELVTNKYHQYIINTNKILFKIFQ